MHEMCVNVIFHLAGRLDINFFLNIVIPVGMSTRLKIIWDYDTAEICSVSSDLIFLRFSIAKTAENGRLLSIELRLIMNALQK